MGKKVNNPAKNQPKMTETQTRNLADAQIWRREFNPDYDQVILRISTAAQQALRCGSPPGTVG